MIRLALLRHGHTAWNRAGRIQGLTDVPLERDSAETLAGLRLPEPWDAAALWSSPLMRATATARLVARRAPRTDPALMEMNWGDWEGQHSAALHADTSRGFRHIEAWGWHWSPPGGESPADLRARLIPWAEALTSDSVAVCHIGVMRVLLAHATGWDFDGPPPFEIKRNRLFVIRIVPGDWQAEPDPIRLEPAP